MGARSLARLPSFLRNPTSLPEASATLRRRLERREKNFLANVKRSVFDGGSGTVELLTRWESLDYSDAPFGGEGQATTLGANWYLNDFTRLMLNAIFWDIDNASGAYVGQDEGITITARAQVSF